MATKRECGNSLDSRLAAGMVETALRADQLAFAAFQQRSAVYTVLPIVKASTGTHRCFDLVFLSLFLCLHGSKLTNKGRHVKLLKHQLSILLPGKSKERDANRFNSPRHVKRFFVGRDGRNVS